MEKAEWEVTADGLKALWFDPMRGKRASIQSIRHVLDPAVGTVELIPRVSNGTSNVFLTGAQSWADGVGGYPRVVSVVPLSRHLDLF